MNEERDYLYERPVKSDTETPRECQIQAIYLASQNRLIPADVQVALLNSAERGKDVLIDMTIDINNASREKYTGEYDTRERYLRFAAQVAFSYGIDGPEAFQRRLGHIRKYVFGLALAELSGPTE
ncbi:MAG: hypothetical protein HYV90_00345 [Candidatus Woesebacteria bacterium]|nr:MAG: hypothetical protein HYV90_00345 [Candidatus Woesebacteria bacterium]